MYGYIYLTTNVTNGMKYIGKHKSEEFDPDYFGSGKILLQSLYKIDDNGRRYKDSSKFTRVILHWCKDKDELNKYEEFFIDKYNAVNGFARNFTVHYNAHCHYCCCKQKIICKI